MNNVRINEISDFTSGTERIKNTVKYSMLTY